MVLWASLDASRETGIDAGLVKDLTSVFAVRAQEAQDGETPAGQARRVNFSVGPLYTYRPGWAPPVRAHPGL
ncbi:hypothetical protein [Streptomyces sp. 35G-GA-8]|uniref:hypothetical protein n=1 Tax=Streptomyces sp. 35G-GA-8 TaxID=2939434 RepID=UPI00201F3DB0|nr:hypothetical protein [Streptomyces sp. 35G-GA-8]MCL7382335.1 hypothetical protein [Streptomyces sp. 35G-GA-8]